MLLQLQSNGQDGELGKIPSAGLVASLITTDHEFDSFNYTTPISCSITTPSYIMRMLARKNGFSPHPYLHHLIELLQSWIKLYSCDIRTYSCIAQQQQGEGCGLDFLQEVKEDFRTRSSGQGAELAGQGS